MTKKETSLTVRDPISMLRQMTSELDRMFDESGWPSFRWPSLRTRAIAGPTSWAPQIDVFEKDNRTAS